MDDEATVNISLAGDSQSALAALRLAARRVPEKIAFVDSPDREARALGKPRSVSFGVATAIVDRLAAHMSIIGLKRGDVFALQLPNIVEAPLCILAAWQAGLVPCMLPVLWRLEEIGKAFASVKPSAALTITQYGEEHPATTLGEAAAHHLSLRFLFGLGGGVPDGIAPADAWFDVSEQDAKIRVQDEDPDDAPRDQAALITWTTGPGGTWPVARTHAQLEALVQMFMPSLSLSRADILLNAYPYTSAASVAGQLVAPMLAEATTALHLPFDYATYLRQLAGDGITCAVAPAPVLREMEKTGQLCSPSSKLRKLACVWPSPFGPVTRMPIPELPYPTIDIHNFAELAILPRRRDDGADPHLHPLDKIRADTDDPDSELLLEMRIRGSVTLRGKEQVLAGVLNVRGATVPDGIYTATNANGSNKAPHLKPDAHGFIDTDLVCVTGEATPNHFRCEKHVDVFYHGGMVLAASELDDLYASFPEFLDAAAFVLDDETIGDRIFAAVVPQPDLSPSLDRLKNYLGQKRVAPHKAPDQLVIVKSIPRSPDGTIQRDKILAQV